MKRKLLLGLLMQSGAERKQKVEKDVEEEYGTGHHVSSIFDLEWIEIQQKEDFIQRMPVQGVDPVKKSVTLETFI